MTAMTNVKQLIEVTREIAESSDLGNQIRPRELLAFLLEFLVGFTIRRVETTQSERDHC